MNASVFNKYSDRPVRERKFMEGIIRRPALPEPPTDAGDTLKERAELLGPAQAALVKFRPMCGDVIVGVVAEHSRRRDRASHPLFLANMTHGTVPILRLILAKRRLE
jgi:hypothetical protein